MLFRSVSISLNCSSLKTVTVDESNKAYSSEDGVLYDKTKNRLITVPQAFEGYLSIPQSVTEIGQGAFKGCSSLVGITVPGGVKTIADSAFANLDSLEKAVLSEGIISIGNNAFHSCSALESIYIPLSVETIGSFAFEWCHALTIYAQAEEKPENWKIYWNSSNRPIIWGCEQ